MQSRRYCARNPEKSWSLMNVRLAHVALVGLLLVSACSDSGGDSSDGSGGNGSGVPTDSATGAGEFQQVDVPAGVNWEASSLAPPATSTVTVPSFAEVTATAGVPAAPAGYPFRQSDAITQLFTVGGMQLASGTCGCWQGGSAAGVQGGLRTPIYLFRSADDGATWAQVDLTSVLGDVNGQIVSIIERDGAMILTASTTDAAAATATAIDVLGSTDGITWQRLSRIISDSAPNVPVHAFAMYSVGASLVVYGGDLACDFDGSSSVQNIGPAYQARFWTSTDGGATWVAQSPADSGLDSGRAPLPDAATCAGLGVQDIIDAYASNPRLVSNADNRVVVWSSDGQRIVSSADGLTWSSATLEGAVAKAPEGGVAPEVDSEAAAILSIDDQFVAVNLENFRTFDDVSNGSSSAYSVLAWTSADGSTWQRQPLGRPLLNPSYDARFEFFVTDAGLGLRAYDPVDIIEYAMFESVAGVSIDWRTCAAAAGANCAFATAITGIEPGADLAGIDLSFATIAGSDLTDVSLAGAHLMATDMVGVTISGTNFDGAELTYVDLMGDLSTASFDGATLTSVRFDDGFFSFELPGASISSPSVTIADTGLPAGVSLAGRDLTGYTLTGGSLAGVDFTGTNLSQASISYTDLTGANFTGAVLEGVFFFEVTCPDGQPMSEDAFGAARCRL